MARRSSTWVASRIGIPSRCAHCSYRVSPLRMLRLGAMTTLQFSLRISQTKRLGALPAWRLRWSWLTASYTARWSGRGRNERALDVATRDVGADQVAAGDRQVEPRGVAAVAVDGDAGGNQAAQV